jgi:apolipoprotein N-acyltransferase
MRAIENQRWIVRATADGITTVVNRAGQIVEPLPSFQDGVLPAYFSYAGETTLYVRLGEWFWWLSLAVSMFALAWTRPK